MARIVTGGFTTFNLGTHLDPMTLDLYGLLEMFAYQAYTGSVAIPSYSGTNIKFRIDGSGTKAVFAIGSSALLSWRASAIAQQFGTFSAICEQSSGALSICFGCYESGTNTFQYSTTGDVASVYSLIGGSHIWYRATASGTAGNPVTLVEDGRFDSAGNFVIGRSKQSGGKLEVAGNMVLQPAAAAPTLAINGDMSFQLVSNTSLKILVRGSDGVTRSATLTLA